MIYSEKYYIEFTSAPDDAGVSTNYRVSLRQRAEEASTATPIRLEGGPSPFILSLGNEDDPLVVQRTAAAQISFFDDIALSNLLPSDASEWQVTLTRTSDNKQIFVGYLTAEVYTQPAIEGPNIITVNAASPMVPIMAETMPIENLGRLSIGTLLRMALTTVGGITRVCMPAMFSLEKPFAASQYTDILRMTFSATMYISLADNASLTGKEYDNGTFSQPIEALCKLFGWSMVDNGDGTLYIVSVGYTGDYMMLSLDDLEKTSSFMPTMTAPSLYPEGSIDPIDKGDVVEVRQGMADVTINVSATDVKIGMPNIEDEVTEQSFVRRKATYTSYGVEDANVEIVELRASVRNENVRLHSYELKSSLNAGAYVDEWTSTEDALSEDNAGARFQEFQWVDPAKIKLNTEDRIRSWTLQPAIRIQEVGKCLDPNQNPAGSTREVRIPSDLPLVTIRAGVGNFSSGALVVNMNVLAISNDGLLIPEDRYIQGGSLAEPTPYDEAPFGLQYFWGNYSTPTSIIGVVCSLRVGDRYWTGARWDTAPATFLLSLSKTMSEWHPAVSNKNVDMLYEDAEGVFIPINTPLAGVVELQVFRREEVSSAGSQVANGDAWYCKDLSISFQPTLEYRIPSVADTTYYRNFRINFSEKKEVELTLHSSINGSEQMSLIYKNSGVALDALYRSTHATAAKPEQFLLDEYQRLYGRVLQRWRRGMMMRELRPIDMFSRTAVSDTILCLTGYTADYEANTLIAYLSDVKISKSIYYVAEV